MKIENLKVGMELKSYRELCELLGVKVKGGKAKNLQMIDIERYIKISKGKGYKLIIDDLYDKPIPKQDNRGNVYGQIVQLLITDMVVESKKEVVLISKGKLLEAIKMVNKNYAYCNANRYKFSKYIDMDIGFIHDFFNTTNSNFSSSIKTALDNLVNRSVINYTWVHTICTKKGLHRVATDEEATLIHKRQKELLREMGYNKISEVMYTPDWKDFKETLKFTLQNEGDYSIDFTYMSYRIVKGAYLEEEQEGMLIKYLEQTEKTKYQDELNQLLLVKLLDNALMRQRKALNKQSKTTNEKLLRYRKDLALNGNTKIIMYHVIDKSNKTDIEAVIKRQQEIKLEKVMDDLHNKGYFEPANEG